jgi:hypothetical protein
VAGFAFTGALAAFAAGLVAFVTGFAAFFAGVLEVLLAARGLVAGFVALADVFALDLAAGSAFGAFLEGAATGALDFFPGLNFALIRAVRLTMMTFLAGQTLNPCQVQKIRT